MRTVLRRTVMLKREEREGIVRGRRRIQKEDFHRIQGRRGS